MSAFSESLSRVPVWYQDLPHPVPSTALAMQQPLQVSAVIASAFSSETLTPILQVLMLTLYWSNWKVSMEAFDNYKGSYFFLKWSLNDSLTEMSRRCHCPARTPERIITSPHFLTSLSLTVNRQVREIQQELTSWCLRVLRTSCGTVPYDTHSFSRPFLCTMGLPLAQGKSSSLHFTLRGPLLSVNSSPLKAKPGLKQCTQSH